MTDQQTRKIDVDTASLAILRESVAGVCVSPYEVFVAIRWRFQVEHFEISLDDWHGLNYAIMRDDAVESQHTEPDGEVVMALHPNNYAVLLTDAVRTEIQRWQWSVDQSYNGRSDLYSRRPDGTFRKHQGR